MKKIALFSLLVALMPVVSFGGDVNSACYATKNCGGKSDMATYGMAAGGYLGLLTLPAGLVSIPASGALMYTGYKLGGAIGRVYGANEYIYFKDGTCLECDKHQWREDYECPNSTVVTNGAEVYKCHVEDDGDYWEEGYIIPVCKNSPVKEKDIKENAKYKFTLKDNMTNDGKRIKDGVYAFSGSVCKWIEQDGSAVVEKAPDTKPGNDDCPTCKKPTCDDWNTAEQKYCCKNAKTGKHHNTTVGVCVCDDNENKKWVWDASSGTGKCIDRGGQSDNKSDEECWYTFESEVQCTNGATIHKSERKKLGSDILGGASCESVKANLQPGSAALQGLIDHYCGNGGGNGGGNGDQNADKANKIKNAREKLSAFFKKIDSDRSVWKNADGSFNATRLASDLTAGVVLGTVGGVVSGVLIKKSQVEKGFDALNCTVNGQKIADWGDEFTVGLRR